MAFFFLATFFLATFFLATFFLATFFLVTFFLAAFFLVAFFLAAFFLAAFFFLAPFFLAVTLLAPFFAAAFTFVAASPKVFWAASAESVTSLLMKAAVVDHASRASFSASEAVGASSSGASPGPGEPQGVSSDMHHPPADWMRCRLAFEPSAGFEPQRRPDRCRVCSARPRSSSGKGHRAWTRPRVLFLGDTRAYVSSA